MAAAPVQSEPQVPICGATSMRMKNRPKATVEATASTMARRSPARPVSVESPGTGGRLQGSEDDADDDGHDARCGQRPELFAGCDRVDDGKTTEQAAIGATSEMAPTAMAR